MKTIQIIFLVFAICLAGLMIYLFIHPSINEGVDEVPFYVAGGLCLIAAAFCGYAVYLFQGRKRKTRRSTRHLRNKRPSKFRV
jgi:hypothetical protein